MTEQGDLFAGGVAEASSRPAFGGVIGCIDLQQRFVASGVEGLDEGDTLALVLSRCLAPGADPILAADALLGRFGGVGRILGAAEADLARVIGVDAARQLSLLHALLQRALEYPLRQRTVLSSFDAVRSYLRVRLAALPREVFHVLFLDKRNCLIADECLGVGSVDHAPVYPREVVRRALELSASAILLAHNHPSGDPTPSRADIDMTKLVVEAAKALQIVVHDHLVVAGGQVASLRSLGLM
ncbi:DNA repair protein RadC [Caulobacter sp. S45]|uniref:RadC family protein n=1 Tax=Caulobacter sp. S45 TaxID=1641861 RepID=UPI00131EB137|nr:DNA repair protein RadC [Caulobacter sp. S45]